MKFNRKELCELSGVSIAYFAAATAREGALIAGTFLDRDLCSTRDHRRYTKDTVLRLSVATNITAIMRSFLSAIKCANHAKIPEDTFSFERPYYLIIDYIAESDLLVSSFGGELPEVAAQICRHQPGRAVLVDVSKIVADIRTRANLAGISF